MSMALYIFLPFDGLYFDELKGEGKDEAGRLGDNVWEKQKLRWDQVEAIE